MLSYLFSLAFWLTLHLILTYEYQFSSAGGLRQRVRTLTASKHRSSFSEHQQNTHHRSPSSVTTAIGLATAETQPLLSQQTHSFENSISDNNSLETVPSVETESSTNSPSNKSTNSSVVEYASRLHPTLLQHYYDVVNMMSSTGLSKNSEDHRGGSSTGPLPALAYQEVVLGDIIGRGGFSFVHEIKFIKLQEIYDTGNEEAASRAAFASTYDETSNEENNTSLSLSMKKPSEQYVLKTLRPDLPEDEHNKGIIDLAVEAQFLAALSHPHILSLRGHANSDPLESRYFVILDRLVSTLDHKLKIWRKDVGINMGYWLGPCLGYCCGKPHVLHRIWSDRFTVARDICSALAYLHAQDIVYRCVLFYGHLSIHLLFYQCVFSYLSMCCGNFRDLKPDNIGFNSEGQLKMFDFGLAKRITNADKTDDELYNLTGNTGSLRYMAPEVAKNMPYSLSVDAYSFGVLLWQLCALQVPYSGYSCKMHADLVVGKGYRPTVDTSWPESWCLLMRQCWAADHNTRPSFEHILKVINEELEYWSAEGDDFMFNEEAHKKVDAATEKIKARRAKSVFKIKARKDRQTLDIDTRLAKPEGPTEKRHDGSIV